MRILVICQYYYPEPFRITDICSELVRRGHEVTVVTGTPNYPMGEIYKGYENGAKSDEVIDGVNVHRCAIHPRKKGMVNRLWNYYSYPYESCRYIDGLDDSFDLVFVYQLSPVMMANAGIKYAKKWGKKVILYCLDIWPVSLSAANIRKGPVYDWFERESQKIYRAVDRIVVTSASFTDYFSQQFGIENVDYLPQYAEEMFSPDACRKTPDGYVDLMFAGNIGQAQSADTIIKAAALCRDVPSLRWHIVGEGTELGNCKKLADELSAPVIFHGRKPLEEMPEYYAMADAMLVTMKKDSLLSMTLPGKVQTYMAAGKPVIGAIDGETKTLLAKAQAGLCCESEDAAGLAEIARSISSEAAVKYGYNAKKYFEANFSREKFFERFEQIMEQTETTYSNHETITTAGNQGY